MSDFQCVHISSGTFSGPSSTSWVIIPFGAVSDGDFASALDPYPLGGPWNIDKWAIRVSCSTCNRYSRVTIESCTETQIIASQGMPIVNKVADNLPLILAICFTMAGVLWIVRKLIKAARLKRP